MNVQSRPFDISDPSDGAARRLWTADELRQMVLAGMLREEERIELIGGDVVTMSPKGARHENLRTRISEYWSDRRPFGVSLADETPLRRSPEDEPQPEIVIYPSEMQVSEVRGGRFGGRESWVINAELLETHIHRSPQVGEYSSIVKRLPSDRIIPHLVPSLAVCLRDLKLG